jgi:hypothetical protein
MIEPRAVMEDPSILAARQSSPAGEHLRRAIEAMKDNPGEPGEGGGDERRR